MPASAGYRERLCNGFDHVECWHPLATASGSVTILATLNASIRSLVATGSSTVMVKKRKSTIPPRLLDFADGRVASTTPSGLPGWGPRSAPRSDVVEWPQRLRQTAS